MQFLNIQLQDIRVQQTAVAAPRALTAAKNGPIAFDSTRDGNTNIYVMNDDGSNLRQLTNSSDYQGEADISPSGQWIAFEEQRDDSFYIYTMPLEGGQPLELVRGRQPDWSPDGGAIAYESVSSPKQLWTIEVSDGRPVGEPVRLPTDSAFSARAPSWSPDGDQIVFMIEVAGYWQLAILDVGRNAYRLITEGDSNKRFPVWSPDGELIAFNTLTPSGAPDQIWVVEPSGEEMHQLTVEGSNGRPAWSPDGRFLLFNSYHDGRWLLYKIDRDGSNPTALTSEGSDQRANWGP
jgi:TolB protein